MSSPLPERTLGRLAFACNRVLICHLVPGWQGTLPRLRNPARADPIGGFTAAVMRPARFAQQVAQFVPPRRMPDVLHHADPFMEHRPQQVEAAQLLDDAIADLFLAGFRLEGARKSTRLHSSH